MPSQRAKRQQRSSQPVVVHEAPTTGLFINEIIVSTPCGIHSANDTQPCYSFDALYSDIPVWGVCNSRAVRAGFDGEINPESLTGRPVGRFNKS